MKQTGGCLWQFKDWSQKWSAFTLKLSALHKKWSILLRISSECDKSADFYTPWKRQKTYGFLTFSWDIETCGFGHILKKSLMEYFSLCALLRLLTAFFSLKNCCKSLKHTCESLIRHYNCICRGGFSDCRARGRIYPQGPYLNIFINQVILQILFRQIFDASKLCTVLPI